jgi:hypothetical protein
MSSGTKMTPARPLREAYDLFSGPFLDAICTLVLLINISTRFASVDHLHALSSTRTFLVSIFSWRLFDLWRWRS